LPTSASSPPSTSPWPRIGRSTFRGWPSATVIQHCQHLRGTSGQFLLHFIVLQIMHNPPQSDVATSDRHTLGCAKGMQWHLSTQHIVLGAWVDSIASHRLAVAWSAQWAMGAHKKISHLKFS
jgi:hypothetical protein